MNKLLSLNLARLKKDKFFWIGNIFMFLLGAVLVIVRYKEHIKYGYEVILDQVFLGFTLLIGIVCAIFCSLFISTEYSDGTIRNKLIVGHTRNNIYLSNFIISTVASLFMCLSFLISVSAFGIPLIGFLKADTRIVLLMLAGAIMMVLAFCSIFTLVSMLNQNKAITVIICLIGVLVFLFAVMLINEKLHTPEFYTNYVVTDSTGNISSEQIPNPEYLRGTKRAIYEFLYDFLPTGQALQYSGMFAKHLWQMPLYSFLITILVTNIGLFIFQKRDIK